MTGRLAIGLDVQPTGVTVVALRASRRGHRLESYGYAPLLPGHDAAQEIRALLQRCGLAARPISLAVSLAESRLLTLDLPEAALHQPLTAAWEAAAASLPPGCDDDTARRTDGRIIQRDRAGATVALAVAPAAAVEQRLSLARSAGVATGRMVPEAVAWQALLARPEVRGHAGRLALVVWDGVTARIIHWQSQRVAGYEEVLPPAPVPGTLRLIPSEGDNAARELAAQVARQLGAHERPPTRVLVAGPSEPVAHFVSLLAAQCPVPVLPADAFAGIPIDTGRFDTATLQAHAPQAAVAVGLALLGAGDLDLLRAGASAEHRPQPPPYSPSPRRLMWVATAAALLLSSGWYALERHRLGRWQDRFAASRAERERDAAAAGEVRRLADENSVLLGHLHRLERLGAQRDLPVRRLEALARARPPGVWVEGVSQEEGTTTLNGAASNVDEVARLMKNLRASPLFAGGCTGPVQLQPGGAEASFRLTCGVHAP